MAVCKCGFSGTPGKFGAHTKNCIQYLNEKDRLKDIDKKYLMELYKKTYSISQCIDELRKDFILGPPTIRTIITQYLKNSSVFEGNSGKNTQAMKQKRIQQTMMERYGVINWGQTKEGGYRKQNKIPYNKLKINDELSLFKKKSDRIARNYLDQCKKNSMVPDKCHYTGITFNDVLLEQVNPNDPFKRTIDHKIPVVEMFLKGKTPEETSHPSNLVFCLRIVNTYKANSSEEYFIQEVLPYLKEKLYES